MSEIMKVGEARATYHARGPDLDGAPAAALGRLKLPDEASGIALLNQACERAAENGAKALLAPLDGDTWHAYRVVTETDGSPPFLMEPTSGPHDLAALRATGFEPVASYLSTIASLDEAIAEPAPPVDGVSIESWDGSDADALVADLYALSTHAFSGNPFFKPIDETAFSAIYRPLVPLLDPRHVLFARTDEGELVGFLFAMQDVSLRDGKRAVILKTYAATQRGVGFLLADTFHRRARDMGFGRVIHALMHEGNASRARSGLHGATVFRRYALMARRFP